MPAFNSDDYSVALNSHPKLKQYDVFVNNQVIKLSPDDKVPRKVQVRGAHVMCSRQHMKPVATICRSIFNRPPKKNADGQFEINLPFGMDARFIPYAGDKWDVTPTASRQRSLRRARDNQRAFISNSRATVIQGVLELDFPIELPDNNVDPPRTIVVSLRQILSSMKTISDVTMPLFSSIMQKWDGDIMGVYDISHSQEATLFLAHLPVYLEFRFGDGVWSWFTTDFRAVMNEFRWCPESCRVIDAPVVSVTDNDEDSVPEEFEADFLIPLVGATRNNFMDDGFETLDDMDPSPEFNLRFQLDLSIIPDHTGLLGTNGDSGASFTTGASMGTALADAPPTEQGAPVDAIMQGDQSSVTNSSLTNSTEKFQSPAGQSKSGSSHLISPAGSAISTTPSNRQGSSQND